MSAGEDRDVGRKRRPRRQIDLHSLGGYAQGARLVTDELEPSLALGCGERIRHETFEIAAVASARDETELGILNPARSVGLIGKPSREMIGIVGEGAHIGRAHIQQVRRVARGIGESAPQLVPSFHDRDASAIGLPAQQMCGHQGAAGASADDDDLKREGFRQGGPHSIDS